MRNVKIAFCHGWRKSRVITDKEPGYYNDFTVSLLTSVPDEVDNKKLIERWDEVCLTKIGELRCIFSYYELLDAETTAKEDYRVSEHNKGDWAKKRSKKIQRQDCEMEKFYAKKEYYIHEFETIQAWFGNRGIIINPGDLKEWCYDGQYLYFTCGENADETITPCYGDDNVMVCALDSICYECYKEMGYQFSPFANKI